MRVYLSSTLNDLEEERDAVRQALNGLATVVDSYLARDESVTHAVFDDLAGCDLYIGILGLRYGFVPPGRATSITQLEYEHARAQGLPRFVFLKNERSIVATNTDAYTREHPQERITAFRALVTSGDDTAPTTAFFDSIDDLRLAVLRAVTAYRARVTGGRAGFTGSKPHPWEIKYEVSIGYVPGTDDDLKEALAVQAQADRRVQIFSLSPADPNYLKTLDERVRQSRCVILAMSAASLPRLTAVRNTVIAAVASVRPRCAGVFALLVDVRADDLPPEMNAVFTDTFVTDSAAWRGQTAAGTYRALQQRRRALSPDSTDVTLVSVPFMVVALNEREAAEMQGVPDVLFARFGDSAAYRRRKFDAVYERVRALAPEWPRGFYGPSRAGWHPFGPAQQSMMSFVTLAARKINAAPPGTRERRLLRDAQLAVHAYGFDDYLDDRIGARQYIAEICSAGCLVVIDELALLHPTLRPHINRLLASNNTAVVAVSPCDPAYSALPPLLEDLSHLRVGNIVSRFSETEDLRCELAVNSVERLQRWLRLVLPELVTTLAQEQSDPSLVDKVDRLLPLTGR